MNTAISIFQLLFIGLFGLLTLLVVLALLFGKRVARQWVYRAEFKTGDARSCAGFKIELSQVRKEETRPSVKAKLRMRHGSLTPRQSVQVFLDDRRVLEGIVEKAGRIYLKRQFGESDLGRIEAGQPCRIVVGGTEFAEEPLRLN